MGERILDINLLWESNIPSEWDNLLSSYWGRIRKNNLAIEKELNNLKIETISSMNSNEWYSFLYNKYFIWKYTAPNRLATTRNQLRKYVQDGLLDELDLIRKRLIHIDKENIEDAIETAKRIRGLGVSGASGLLSLLYPEKFGAVDQFLVKSLNQITNQKQLVENMNPENLTIKDAVLLINILREKAKLLNKINNVNFWTPRKIDMALWAYR